MRASNLSISTNGTQRNLDAIKARGDHFTFIVGFSGALRDAKIALDAMGVLTPDISQRFERARQAVIRFGQSNAGSADRALTKRDVGQRLTTLRADVGRIEGTGDVLAVLDELVANLGEVRS